MELEVKRIYWDEIEGHDDVEKTAFIEVDGILKLEQSLRTNKHTELILMHGETITIAEEIHTFKKRATAFKEQKENEKREKQKRDDLGY